MQRDKLSRGPVKSEPATGYHFLPKASTGEGLPSLDEAEGAGETAIHVSLRHAASCIFAKQRPARTSHS